MASPAKSRERKCSTCRHYQPSPLWRKGWCRNPLLYDRNTNHLVEADSLSCNRTFIDYWEPLQGPVPGNGSASIAKGNARPRIAPSIPMTTVDAQGNRGVVTGNTPAQGMSPVGTQERGKPSLSRFRPASYRGAGTSLDELDTEEQEPGAPEAVDPKATQQIEEVKGPAVPRAPSVVVPTPDIPAQASAARPAKAKPAPRTFSLFGLTGPALYLPLAALLSLALLAGVTVLRGQPRAVVPVVEPTAAPTQPLPTPTGFGDPTPTTVVTPSPSPEPPPTDRLAIGGYAQVANTPNGLRVRAEPSTSSARVTSLAQGVVARIVEGPQEADGITWWKLEGTNAGEPFTGWCAGQFLVPAPPPTP